MTDPASSRPKRKAAPRKSKPEPADAPARPSVAQRRQEVLYIARQLYKHRPHWLTFQRELFGVGGVVHRLFTTDRARAAFEESQEYAEIVQMTADLQARGPLEIEVEDREPLRIMTVRLPRSMHEALRAEAADYRVSMNKLCLAKLVRALDAHEESQKKGGDKAK